VLDTKGKDEENSNEWSPDRNKLAVAVDDVKVGVVKEGMLRLIWWTADTQTMWQRRARLA
jgi:hypothetical protein